MIPQVSPRSGRLSSRFVGRLFPRFVGRVAGIPASALEGLCAVRTLRGHAALRDLDQELEEVRERLIPLLFARIQGLGERELRRQLLRLKRDVHNRRPLYAAWLGKLEERLAPELWAMLACYQKIQEQRRGHMLELHAVFEQELAGLRRKFQRLVECEDFKNGLLLSSRTLAGQLPRYVRAAAARPGSKARQVERSLMRYFSRAALKTTPFSTFCALVPGTFHAPENGSATVSGDPFRKRGLLRINKVLCARILDHLLERPGVRPHFHVELNPTLGEEGGRWRFLTAAGGREVFQRLGRNALLEELRQRLAGAPRPLAELIDLLVCDPEIQAEEKEAKSYLDRLLEIGFLRFRSGIREQEVDWDRPLVKFLAELEDGHTEALRGFLDTLRAGLEEYSDASFARRREILDAAGGELKTLQEQLKVELLPPYQPLFYEDAGGAAELCLAPGDLAEILVEYVAFISRLARPRAELAGMRHFFDTYYDPEHGPVPLLTFYEDYFREHFKEHLERERQRRAAGLRGGQPEPAGDDPGEKSIDVDLDNPFNLEIVRAIHEAARGLCERIRTLWRQNPNAEEIRLERRDLAAILCDVPEEGATCRSASLFVQWLPASAPGEESGLVVDGLLSGYGKYFSRFLAVLPDAVRREVIVNNRRLTAQELAEICGDGAFNANLHPPLLPREISYPTGESGTAAEQIPSAQLEVERDPRDPHRLSLRWMQTGEEVVPVDLGFLNPRLRPPLFRLLSTFTPPANFDPLLPQTTEPDSDGGVNPGGIALTDGDEATVQHRPRITYRGRLVLARRQWQIPLAAFPRRGPNEREAEYFLRLQDWRAARGLPEEVFLRVHTDAPSPPPEPAADETTAENNPASAPRPRGDLYKPQYIDFRNPLLVDVFSRTAENLERAIFTFEERLPRSDQLLSGGGEPCVTELIVQVDFPARREEGADV